MAGDVDHYPCAVGADGASSGVSSYASGGGGVTLEQLYAATLLSGLLVGGTVAELGDGSEIKRVRFQAREESPVDDLLISGTVRGQERRVAIGVRRRVPLTAGHDKTKKLLATYVQMAAEQREEIEAGRLRLCLAVGAENPSVQELRKLVEAAVESGDETTFRAKINDGGPDSALSKRLVHVDALVAAAAQSLGPLATDARALTWHLLRCLLVRSLRLEDDTADRANALNILMRLNEAKTPEAADALFARILELAGRYARAGAKVTRARLRKDLGMPAVPGDGSAQEALVHGVVVGVDVEKYSRRNIRQQFAIQQTLDSLLDEAAQAAGLGRRDWRRSPGGDGELAILPADVDMVKVVSGFFSELGRRLTAYNDGHSEERFRLRAAVHMGMTVPGAPLGTAGPAPVDLSRLLDSRELRQELEDDAEASIVFLVSSAVYDSVAGSGFEGLERRRFRRLTVDNPGKGFRQDAYRYFAEDLAEVPEDWGTEDAGKSALVRPGWSLERDPENARHWDPRARGVGISSEKGWRFQGRTAALRKIVDWLDREVPDRGVLVVTGSPGAGKSAVLGRIVTTADTSARGRLPTDDTGVKAGVGVVHCAVHAKGKTALEVAGEIARAALASVPERIEDFAPALEEAFRGPGREGLRNRFNVVIDALDEASSPEQAREIAQKVILPLTETFADDGARIVTATRRTDGGGDLLRAFEDAGQVIDLDTPEYFAEEDLTGYALACLQVDSSERPGGPSPYTDAEAARPLAEAIARAADGNFLIGGLIARTRGLYDKQAADPTRLKPVRSVRDALEEYLRRLPGIGRISAGRLLTALAFAEDSGLTADLWSLAVEALPPGRPDEDWPVQVQAKRLDAFARSGASNFLVETSGRPGPGSPGERSYRLFHQALSEALLAARAEFTDREDDERELTRAFLRAGRNADWGHAPEYLLRSLPAHAVRAGLTDDLLADDAYLLHADLRRLIEAADGTQCLTSAGQDRVRLLRLTPRALAAVPGERAALFSVTEALENLGNAYRDDRWQAPYRALWAAAAPRREQVACQGHAWGVNAVCTVKSAGRVLLATGSNDETVRLWNPDSGEQVRILECRGRVNAVCTVKVGDQVLLAVATSDQTVQLWDPVIGKQIEVLECRRGSITAMCAIRAEGQIMLAAITTNLAVQLFDPQIGELARLPDGYQGPVESMCAVEVEGRVLLATGSNDGRVCLWDPGTAKLTRVLKGHYGEINAMCAVEVEGRVLLATGSEDGTVWLWNLDTGKPARVLTGREVRAMCAVEMEGRTLLATASGPTATAAGRPTVQVWDPVTGKRTGALECHRTSITAMCAVEGEGRGLFATASNDRTARLWSLSDVEQADTRDGHQGGVYGVCAVDAGRRTLLATASDDQTVQLWDPGTGEQVWVLKCHWYGRFGGANVMCAVDREGRVLLATCSSAPVQLWDPGTGEQVRVVSGMGGDVWVMCTVEVGGRVLLATAGNSVRVRLWDPGTGEQVRVLKCHHGVNAMCMVAVGSRVLLATSSEDGEVCLWDPGTGKPAKGLNARGCRVMCTVEVGGRVLLATAGNGVRVQLWDPGTGEQVRVLKCHHSAIKAMCTVEVGGRLLLTTGSEDGTLQLWDPRDGANVVTIPAYHRVHAVTGLEGSLAVGLDAGVLVIKLDSSISRARS